RRFARPRPGHRAAASRLLRHAADRGDRSGRLRTVFPVRRDDRAQGAERVIERFLAGLQGKMGDPEDCTFMTVAVPGDIDPMERHQRFSVMIDAELRLAGLGCSEGGGTLYWEPEEDGEPEIAYAILD